MSSITTTTAGTISRPTRTRSPIPACPRRRSPSPSASTARRGRRDLAGRPRPLLRTTFHEALEVDRAVLARKVDVALPDALVSAEGRVLAGRPARVAPEEVGIAPWCAHGGLAVPLRGRARPHRFELRQELLNVFRRCRGVGRVHVRLRKLDLRTEASASEQHHDA